MRPLRARIRAPETRGDRVYRRFGPAPFHAVITWPVAVMLVPFVLLGFVSWEVLAMLAMWPFVVVLILLCIVGFMLLFPVVFRVVRFLLWPWVKTFERLGEKENPGG